MKPCVLVLAGLDPSGGAGLLADAEAIREAGARPLCVATALTAQTTRYARGFQALSPAFALESARGLLEEEPVAAVKIGMLRTPQMAHAVADLLAEVSVPAVLDPVLSASSGAPLFRGNEDAIRSSYAALLPLVALITPNAPEARILLDLPEEPADVSALETAARRLVALGARAALVKGGHLRGESAVDVLCQGEECIRLSSPRIEGPAARGTGCRLASAIAAGLARGVPLAQAAREAKELVARYIRAQRDQDR